MYIHNSSLVLGNTSVLEMHQPHTHIHIATKRKAARDEMAARTWQTSKTSIRGQEEQPEKDCGEGDEKARSRKESRGRT